MTLCNPVCAVFEIRWDQATDVLLPTHGSKRFLHAFAGHPVDQKQFDDVVFAPAEEPPAPLGDVSFLSAYGILLISRAISLELADVWATCGQLFPIRTQARGHGEFLLFNPTIVADALDYERSTIEFWPSKSEKIVRKVREFEFKVERLAGLLVFKLPEFVTTRMYATAAFVDRWRSARFTGIQFSRVWPPPDKQLERQRFLEKRARKKGRQ